MSGTVSQVTSALSPNSPQAAVVRTLMVGVIVMVSAIALLVASLVTVALIRFGDRGVTPVQEEGKRWIEVVYTVIPLGLMIALFVCTVLTMVRAEPPTDQPPELVIVAHQWWWELRYPDAHVVSANEIHLPVGVPFRTELISADVIHEVWLPQLGPKLDAVPGHPNRFLLQSDTTGVFLGACAEFCGAEHALMRLRVIVQTPADFQKWEAAQQQLPGSIAGVALQGRDVFLSHSCMQCHTIDGTTAQGTEGPNLTHLASRGMLAADTLPNTPENLRLWLADPQTIKPQCNMPKMYLTDQQLAQTSSYLESLK